MPERSVAGFSADPENPVADQVGSLNTLHPEPCVYQTIGTFFDPPHRIGPPSVKAVWSLFDVSEGTTEATNDPI